MITTFPESTFYRASFHSLADTYFEQERYDEARSAYGNAMEGDNRSVRVVKSIFRLVKWYKDIGEENKKDETYEQTIIIA